MKSRLDLLLDPVRITPRPTSVPDYSINPGRFIVNDAIRVEIESNRMTYRVIICEGNFCH